MRYAAAVSILLILSGAVIGFTMNRSFKYPVPNAFPTSKNWKEVLSREEYWTIRDKGTERAGSGKYANEYPKEGYFACRACGQPLYSAQSKFESGCGWPSFDKCYEGSVVTQTDADGSRVEILCSQCGGHLGHVFEGEWMTSTNERHCTNSISLKYHKETPEVCKKEVKVV